jgi:GH24 family phage-related lysozyme (muramidase)
MGWFPRHNFGQVNLKRLIKQLEIDVGKRLKVYNDVENSLAVGIGHKISKKDPLPIRSLNLGDSITEAQSRELFEIDLATALSDFRIIFPDWETIPSEAQEVLLNMLFSLGRDNFLSMKELIATVYTKNWGEVAKQMESSFWYTQYGERARRLTAKMRIIHDLSSEV